MNTVTWIQIMQNVWSHLNTWVKNCFRYWLGTEWVTSQNMNQWWSSLLALKRYSASMRWLCICMCCRSCRWRGRSCGLSCTRRRRRRVCAVTTRELQWVTIQSSPDRHECLGTDWNRIATCSSQAHAGIGRSVFSDGLVVSFTKIT